MDKILKLLEEDSTLTPEELALMLSKEVGDVKKIIEGYEKDGVILGYKTIIDWDKTDREYVSALIEVKVTPQRDRGFNKIAEKIYNHPEVKSLYLMSGGYDLNVVVKGKNLQDIARFVARELATIDSVTSTATHFVMRRYKEMDVQLISPMDDDRGQIWV